MLPAPATPDGDVDGGRCGQGVADATQALGLDQLREPDVRAGHLCVEQTLGHVQVLRDPGGSETGVGEVVEHVGDDLLGQRIPGRGAVGSEGAEQGDFQQVGDGREHVHLVAKAEFGVHHAPEHGPQQRRQRGPLLQVHTRDLSDLIRRQPHHTQRQSEEVPDDSFVEGVDVGARARVNDDAARGHHGLVIATAQHRPVAALEDHEQ